MTDIALDEELAPCPFCGKEPILIKMVEDDYDRWHKVMCEECGIEMGEEYRSDAIAAWNRRASPSQVAPQPQAGALDQCALEALKNNQRQLDMDGCEVGISRQALEELLAAYATLSQPANPVQVTDAWLEYERTRIKGDNPQCHPHIYFQRGYEAAIAANPAQVGGSNLAERAKAVRGDLEAHNFDDVIALLDDYAAAIGAGGQAVAIISKAEAKLAAYAFDEDEETEFSREDAVFVLSALSQPHPADERVVEALRRMLSLFDEQGNLIADFAPLQDAINGGYRALSAKEGR